MSNINAIELLQTAIAHLDLLDSLDPGESVRDRLANEQARHVSQIAKSAAFLLDQEHGIAFNILLRSITDSIFRTAWGLKSEENACLLEQGAHSEFRKNLKSLIKDGHLSFVNSETNDSINEEIIERAVVKTEIKLKNIREMAIELDLEMLYQILYKPLSMQSHGSYGVIASNPPIMTNQERASALLAGVQIITTMAGKWLTLRQAPTADYLRGFFFTR